MTVAAMSVAEGLWAHAEEAIRNGDLWLYRGDLTGDWVNCVSGHVSYHSTLRQAALATYDKAALALRPDGDGVGNG